MDPVAISFLNMKGGCGKTSVTFHLAGALAEAGAAVLLFDLDPQANLTQGIFGSERSEELDASSVTITDLFKEREVDVLRHLVNTGIVNKSKGRGRHKAPAPGSLSILPGSCSLRPFNDQRTLDAPLGLQRALREVVLEAKELRMATHILIDCPPTLGLLSWVAILASDFVIVPVQPEDYGVQGIKHVQEFVGLARNHLGNPDLENLGYLPTMVKPRAGVHISYLDVMRSLYGGLVFEQCVPDTIRFPEALLHHLPITHHKPRSAAARAMRAVAEEIDARILAAGPVVIPIDARWSQEAA